MTTSTPLPGAESTMIRTGFSGKVPWEYVGPRIAKDAAIPSVKAFTLAIRCNFLFITGDIMNPLDGSRTGNTCNM
jgi:hypothetical protein